MKFCPKPKNPEEKQPIYTDREGLLAINWPFGFPSDPVSQQGHCHRAVMVSTSRNLVNARQSSRFGRSRTISPPRLLVKKRVQSGTDI